MSNLTIEPVTYIAIMKGNIKTTYRLTPPYALTRSCGCLKITPEEKDVLQGS